MAHVSRIYEAIGDGDPALPRQRKLLSKEQDLMIALNHYKPGARNEFHYHKGTSQSFLCVKGCLTLETKDTEDGPVETHYLVEGDCALIPGNQYYRLHNESDGPALLYQVKKPGDEIMVAGRGAIRNSDYFTSELRSRHTL